MLTASRMLSACTVALDSAAPSRTSMETLITGFSPSSSHGCSLSLMPGGRSRTTPRPLPAAEDLMNAETRAPRLPPRGRECSHRGACQRLSAAGRVTSRVGNGCRTAPQSFGGCYLDEVCCHFVCSPDLGGGKTAQDARDLHLLAGRHYIRSGNRGCD